jgi:protein gp37
MGSKTKIEYADSTWSPVTGCLHWCEYCYARDIVRRFGKETVRDGVPDLTYIKPLSILGVGDIYELTEPLKNPYPFGFTPTLHRYRLGVPQTWKAPHSIFVCSMADLFGEWVPDEWIEAVFEACAAAPQHRYLFLTKNPKRYVKLDEVGRLPTKHWYGTTATTADNPTFMSNAHHTFWSIEPILGAFPGSFSGYARGLGLPLKGKPNPKINDVDWIVIGAMTGPGAKKHQPRREWIEDICAAADNAGVPVFMKDSLAGIVGEENMRRELPWRAHK